MICIGIIGAAGRMGQRLIDLTLAADELELVGAIEAEGHPALGTDAGCGSSKTHLAITADLQALLPACDVVIDFSSRDRAVDNCRQTLAAGCGFVLGTTGLSDAEKEEIHRLAAGGGRLVFAPNFSVGINLMFAVCGQIAEALGSEYDIEVVEMHHNQKLDAPSGTAERIGEVLAAARGLDYAADTVHGRHGQVGKRPRDQIGMHALRGGDVVGEHTVVYATGGERIELTHRASSRDTFARGALRAAKFLAHADPGDYDMKQVLGL